MRRPLAALLAVLALTAAPAAVRGQSSPAILVGDVTNGTRVHALTASVPLRRGITSHVKIVKDLIDLVPFGMVSISGGGTISNITNGRTSQGKGFIAMNVAVPSGQTVGSTITLKVGLHDEFSFRAVHRGVVSGITRTPDPATVAAGTPWVATVNGTDLGNGTLNASFLDCHTITAGPRTANSAQFTVTRGSGCTGQTQFTVAMQGSNANDPPSYPLQNGLPASFAFQYFVPSAGEVCASNPNVGAPIIRQPLDNQVLQFFPATTSPTNVLVRWDSITNTAQAAPKNEWIVTARSVSATLGGISLAGSIKQQRTFNVRGLQLSIPLAVPDTHIVTIRAKNCDQSAPSASVTVRMIFQ